MRRLALILFVTAALAQPAGCQYELTLKWNRFAKDANHYVNELDHGVVDLKTRAKLDREWREVTQCQCW